MTVHVTIPVDEAVKADLDAWALARGVPLGEMLSEAIDDYVQEAREIAAAVAESRADVAAGRVYTQEEVVAHLRARRAVWGAEPE